jgi:hypothetical protein
LEFGPASPLRGDRAIRYNNAGRRYSASIPCAELRVHNRFTCCYRNERSSVDNPKDKRIETFGLNDFGTAQFFKTLTADTHVLIESTVTTFSFARLFKDRVKEVVTANTYELKQISAYVPRLARCNTDKIDADKLCRIIKMQVLAGEQLVSPVTIFK